MSELIVAETSRGGIVLIPALRARADDYSPRTTDETDAECVVRRCAEFAAHPMQKMRRMTVVRAGIEYTPRSAGAQHVRMHRLRAWLRVAKRRHLAPRTDETEQATCKQPLQVEPSGNPG